MVGSSERYVPEPGSFDSPGSTVAVMRQGILHMIDRGRAEDLTELVRAAQDDQPGALERLVDRSLPMVLRWCVRLGGPGVQAEDAAQDVFEIVLDRLVVLRSPDAYSAWLYGVTRRVLARHRRRAWLRRWVPGLDPEGPDPGGDPLRMAEATETARRVWAAMGTLQQPHREVLVLCDLEERADSEVAEMLGIPKATVKSRLRRAREALRAQLPELRDVSVSDEPRES